MHPAPHRQFLISVALLGVLACAGPENQFEADSDDARAALIARAASFELDTEYVPPPGQALHHYTSGFAKTLCSAVFITGLDPGMPQQTWAASRVRSTNGDTWWTRWSISSVNK